jgi:methylmalonyl-CoA mutase
VGADPIGALAENGFLKKPPETYYDEMADSVRFAEKNAPALRTVLADANVWANAGATP